MLVSALVPIPLVLLQIFAVARSRDAAQQSELPKPLDRAQAALQGLLEHFVQTESGVEPTPRPKDCPCFSCSGKNCTHPTCGFCSVYAEANCVTPASPGCYTTAENACTCDLPDINPQPPGIDQPAKFLFACGQIGGMGPDGKVGDVSDGVCLCETDWTFSCTNCFRWWTAIGLEASVNYCIEAGLSWNGSSALCAEVNDIAQSMWAHSPYNEYWDGALSAVYVDDFVWYSSAYARMFDWTGDEVWRERAMGLHSWAWKYGWDDRTTNGTVGKVTNGTCGGFWWSLWKRWPYKDSITVVEVLFAGAKLASTYREGEEERAHLIERAITVWSWLFLFDNGKGLFAPNGIMSTGAVPEWCCAAHSAADQSNSESGPPCSNSRAPGMSYNHGLLMSSAALLYNLTANRTYLAIGLQLLDAAFDNLTDSWGAVKDVQRGSRVFSGVGSCRCGRDPGSDFFSFSGIFAAHLAYFADMLQKSNALPTSAVDKVRAILETSSDNAWTRSAFWPPFDNSKDTCYTIPSSSGGAESSRDRIRRNIFVNSSAPKFSWWWSNPKAAIETPPDAGTFFTRNGLHCIYHSNSSILWQGTVNGAQACLVLCAENMSCSKYMFKDGSKEISNNNDCQCFTCLGEECLYPFCSYCGAGNERSCRAESNSKCYTNASAGCLCPSSTASPTPADVNCWLFRSLTDLENRTKAGGCNTISSGFVVGAKRPPPPSATYTQTSCRNRCNAISAAITHHQRQVVSDSGLCSCDRACALHLDCCLDYVEVCTPEIGQSPTCEGKCSESTLASQKALAVPIQGGGYCYCDASCGNIFTDNNSYGGCCGDYMYQCGGQPKDPICFDARSQGSALHLFVAHHLAEKVVNVSHAP